MSFVLIVDLQIVSYSTERQEKTWATKLIKMQCLVGAVWSLRRTSKAFGFAQHLTMGGKKMVKEIIHIGVYQKNKQTIEKIKSLMNRHQLQHIYRTYNKWSVTFWRVDSDFIELTAFARSLLDLPGVHEAKIIHRLRNISTPKEAYWGPDILRLTVEFYEY